MRAATALKQDRINQLKKTAFMHSTVKIEEPAVYLKHIFTYGRKGKAQATTLFSLSFFFFTQLYVLKNVVACDAPSGQVENSTHAKGTT